ncbi:MAG: rRNA maturation RNase YbeY [bacterium]|nr:rRNA maturation RNase YbeY [bacterium]
MSPLFRKIKNHVLGKQYDLSVAFLNPTEMRKITRKTKKINKASNVLAFPLSKTSGEILICKATAKKEAKQYGMTEKAFVSHLFIHGLYHLKGYKHSATMERIERRTFKKFGFKRNE